MMNTSSVLDSCATCATCTTWVVSVPRCDRWSVCRRLQELDISCTCPQDGTLQVEAESALAAVLIHSTVRQFTTTRREQANWLERCWEVDCPR